MSLGKQIFTMKTYGAQLYQWSPTTNDKKIGKTQKPFYCNAIPYSQGQDWITSYVYNLSVSDIGEQQKLAYVECGYVE